MGVREGLSLPHSVSDCARVVKKIFPEKLYKIVVDGGGGGGGGEWLRKIPIR